MKILLVQPPPRRAAREDIVVPPLGIAYLAAVLEREGHEVSVLDAFAEGLDTAAAGERIRRFSPDAVGITGMTPVIDNAFRLAAEAKRHAPVVILGGPHVSVAGQRVFEQCADIDYAIQGEGERSVPRLLAALSSGGDLRQVEGLITREFVNPPARFVDDLDGLPFPARHLLPNDRYRYILSTGKVTTMFTSRGCPYRCIFCDKAVFGSRWRSRSAASVLDEMEQANREFGIGSIVIYDDLFTVNRERTVEICRGILDRGLKIEWKCEGRVNIVDAETLRWMKRAGCTMIAYGVESGNQSGLDYLDKGTTLDQVRNAFALTRKAGIKPMAYFILGIPVETYRDELRTIAFAKEIRPAFAQFSILSPTPGTKLYDDAVANGWYREVDARNPMDKDLKRPAILNENWDEEKLTRILREAHRRFYLDPRYVLERLGEIRDPRELFRKAAAGIKLLRWYLSSLRA